MTRQSEGSPDGWIGMSEQEIALKALIKQRHMSYEGFCREWDRTASSRGSWDEG